MAQYRKKPVVVDAVHWVGGVDSLGEVCEFMQCTVTNDPILETIRISTLEGTMTASKGDWIIRGVRGEFYPVKPDIFASTYELV